MQETFNEFARSLSMSLVIALALVGLIGWAAIGAVLRRRMRRIGLVLFILTALAILYVTVLSRSKVPAAHSYLTPFSTFERAKTSGELYNFLLMNIIMFLPIGFTLPFVLKGKAHARILWTIFSGFLFSVLIEALQGIFSVGYVDVDDVIANTLGTAIGSLSYLMTLLFLKLKKEKPDAETLNA